MIITTIRITKDLISMIDKVIEKTGVAGRSNHIRRAIYGYCRRLLDEKKGE
jgi:metal-responsive CopG/Arc/MetJ family transcriptional regulator